MKRVDIISKVVGRYSSGKPVGGGISIPMGNYALKSDFESLKSMFNDFLEGDDTDSVINRWKDLESFLNGISEDNTLDSILKDYVTLSGTQTITGEKNFTGGLKVNGSPIYYDTEKKYWKLEGDLLVTGGVTMYGNDSEFVASTIMDAIVVDGTTISKEGGILKVIGDATTLGSLTNVGSWADSVSSQDRIMYQAANSSQWVAKNLSDLAVGGVSGDYLPLSGGILSDGLTINQNTRSALVLNEPNGGKTEIVFQKSGSTKGGIRLNDSNYLESLNVNKYQWELLLTSDNYSSYALPLSGGTMTGTINTQFIRPSVNATYQCGTSSLRWDNVYSVYGNFSNSITINGSTVVHAGNISSYNAGSATKLQTERTIWGQSFNGTGNVDGTFTVTSNENLPIRIHSYYSSSWVSAILATNTSLVAGQHFNINVGYGDSAYNNAWVGYYHAGVGSTSNRLSMGLHSVDDVINILGTGNVGIGTTNPGDKLSIAGGCGVNDYLNIVATNNVTAQFTMYASSGGWRFQNNPNANGNLELIFRSPSAVFTSVANFTSSGNILVTGGVTMYSARKLKSIKDERGLSLEELSVIKPTRFTWKDGRDNKVHIGGIADDVQKVLPEVIYKADNDTLTMDYGNAAFAIAASLIKPVVNHEERIKMLEEENKRLKEEVEQLKWNIA